MLLLNIQMLDTYKIQIGLVIDTITIMSLRSIMIFLKFICQSIITVRYDTAISGCVEDEKIEEQYSL